MSTVPAVPLESKVIEVVVTGDIRYDIQRAIAMMGSSFPGAHLSGKALAKALDEKLPEGKYIAHATGNIVEYIEPKPANYN
ncbi:hypothetical protein HYS31_00650 [Candidatus Woesearchaeota archaeon]|nr:hypothetical protein [Candidatus Woesearchaeota archaeon]